MTDELLLDDEIVLDDEIGQQNGIARESVGPIMEILPADFPLPILARFCPDPRLKQAADEATAYALAVKVEGAEGVQRADLTLTALATSLKAIEECFAQPIEIANSLHKTLTTKRADWLAAGKAAKATVGARLSAELRRLDAIAAEIRRKAQEEADRAAREQARREREAAEKAQAPAPVVEELKRQEATITAPPVQSPVVSPTLRGNTVVRTWKCRLRGTPADAEPNPAIGDLSPAQRLQVFELLKAILDGRAPIAAIAIDWSYANKRAEADKGTFQIPGLEAFQNDGTRSKGSRARG